MYHSMEMEIATHSSILRRRQWHSTPVLLPGKSHGWRSLEGCSPLRVGHNWVTSLSLFTFMHWRRKWQPTLVFLPGGLPSLGSHRVGHDWSNLTTAAASILAWEIPWIEETEGLQCMGLQRVKHNLVTEQHQHNICLCRLCLIQIFILNSISSDVCSCWSASLMPSIQGGFTGHCK